MNETNKGLVVVVVILITFCAATLPITLVLQQQAINDGYGMGAGQIPYYDVNTMDLNNASDLIHQTCFVAGMPRELFEQHNPIPTNVLIDSFTINLRLNRQL